MRKNLLKKSFEGINLSNHNKAEIRKEKTDFISNTRTESNNKEKRKSIIYDKLKFNKNILLDLLKKNNLKIINKSLGAQKSKIIDSFLTNRKRMKNDKNKSSIKKYKYLPGINKYHNLTDEIIQKLRLENISNTYTIPNFSKKNHVHRKNKSITINSFKIHQNIPIIPKTSITDIIIDLKKGNYCSKNRKVEKRKMLNNFLQFSPLEISNIRKINNRKNILEVNEEKKNDNDFNSCFDDKCKWLTSYKDYLRKFNLHRRSSVIDRLVFVLEKPMECFEETVIEEKPADKYQLFKNQIIKHKYKIYDTINEIKLNQRKNENQLRIFINNFRKKKKNN